MTVVSNLTTTEFIKSFKRLTSIKGKSKIVYCDNSKTFKAEAKWLANINKDQKLNVPKTPWWGGQFERLIGLIKECLYRTIGKQLTWTELEEALLDTEIVLNNMPLTYIEKKIDYPILTPRRFILGGDVNLLDTAPHASESGTMKKRTKNVNGCKEALWKRWKHDYLVALREKHSLKHEDKTFKINVGNAVMIKGEEENRGH